ncbi:MAG TPA: hypothetical protein VLF19_10010 [Methylomirabilota bacterium]|nr:hypothetical protein [Methylomirabilota bacterium]
MAARKKTRKTVMPSPRSAKAGRPPREVPASSQVRRRRKTATAAVRKDSMVQQTAEARIWWGVGKPKEKKR